MPRRHPAAQANYLSGTVYEGGAFYRSSVLRHITTANDTVEIEFSELPSDYILWYITNAKTGKKIGSEKEIIDFSTYVVLAKGVASGTTFYNNYASASNCNYNCGNYNFKGYEIY